MEKEVKKCEKVETALQVMYKKYYAKDKEFGKSLKSLNKQRDRLNIEKSVF